MTFLTKNKKELRRDYINRVQKSGELKKRVYILNNYSLVILSLGILFLVFNLLWSFNIFIGISASLFIVSGSFFILGYYFDYRRKCIESDIITYEKYFMGGKNKKRLYEPYLGSSIEEDLQKIENEIHLVGKDIKEAMHKIENIERDGDKE